mmetsp:Transcript_46126/g.148148  ORF Transcript_46126/g.148148 Transcript_46126/m.148148 type:complete len:302 (+) Transcript_46126:539-1444(+)
MLGQLFDARRIGRGRGSLPLLGTGRCRDPELRVNLGAGGGECEAEGLKLFRRPEVRAGIGLELFSLQQSGAALPAGVPLGDARLLPRAVRPGGGPYLRLAGPGGREGRPWLGHHLRGPRPAGAHGRGAPGWRGDVDRGEARQWIAAPGLAPGRLLQLGHLLGVLPLSCVSPSRWCRCRPQRHAPGGVQVGAWWRVADGASCTGRHAGPLGVPHQHVAVGCGADEGLQAGHRARGGAVEAARRTGRTGSRHGHRRGHRLSLGLRGARRRGGGPGRGAHPGRGRAGGERLEVERPAPRRGCRW